MKKEIQRNFRFIVLLAIVIFFPISLFTSCGEEEPEQPKEQSATLTNLFGEGYTATIKGYLTDTEWNGITDKVKTALNNGYNSGTGPEATVIKGRFKNVFDNGIIIITIIIEKNPSGYSKWKTSTDGKTMYLSFGSLNNDLQGSVTAAVNKMTIPEAGFVQIIDRIKLLNTFFS